MSDQQRRHGKGGGGGDPHPGEKKDVALAINALNRTYESANNKNNEHSNVQLKWTRRTAIAAIAYTVITAALLAAGIYSAVEASRAVNEASRAADAATSQAGTAKETEHQQLRAYVGVIPGDVEDFGNQQQFSIKLTRKNYGLTPAYDVGVSEINVGVLPQNASILSNGNHCGHPTQSGLVTMFPSAELPLTVSLIGKLSSEQIIAVNQKVAFLFWYGNICYNDAFGVKHYTNYCWQYKGSDMTAKHVDGCLLHNDSD